MDIDIMDMECRLFRYGTKRVEIKSLRMCKDFFAL